MPLFRGFWKRKADDDSSGDECEDATADKLSYVGMAAYNVLRRHHNHYHHELWNVTEAKVVGNLQFTPTDAFSREDRVDPQPGHSDWFPDKIYELIIKTENWCDIMSLAPPDGLFMDAFKRALNEICNREIFLGRITIRMMFGNLPGMPLNITR
jgi:hypothetical protein